MSTERWTRVLYRRNKVFTQVDEQGRPLRNEAGLAAIRYREDDPREYSVRADDLAPITDAALAEIDAVRAQEKAARRRARQPIRIYTAVAPGADGGDGVGVVLETDGFRREMARALDGPAPELVGVRAALTRIKQSGRPVRITVETAHTLKVIDGQWEAGVNAALVDEVHDALDRFDDWRVAKAKSTDAGLARARRLASAARDGAVVDRLAAIDDAGDADDA